MRIIIETEAHERPIIRHREDEAAVTLPAGPETGDMDGGVAPELDGLEAPVALAGSGEGGTVEGEIAAQEAGPSTLDAGPAPSFLAGPPETHMEDVPLAGLGPVGDVEA